MSQERLREEHVTISEVRADGATPSRSVVSQVLRYWWVVAIIVALCIAGAIMATTRVPTTYTGRASLIVSSPNRSPDQDAVLVQGYVDYFNDGAYHGPMSIRFGALSIAGE